MRHKYQCIECHHIFNGGHVNQDGISCPLCKSYASPIGPADPALDKLPPKEKLKIIVTDDHKMQVFMDGKRVKGVISITFSKRTNEHAIHTIEYGSSICAHVENDS